MTELFEFDDETPLPPRARPWRVPVGTQLPPPPPGTRHVRAPGLGIVIADDDVRERVERTFHWPMILLAVAVLPLLALEVQGDLPKDLAVWVDVGFGLVWVAFLIEFVVKIAVAESRWEYVKRNWLDLVVILLPVLRVLRISALGRSVRLLRLRGVALKAARSAMTLFVTFSVADRLLRRLGVERDARPDRPPPASMTRYALIDEVSALRARNDRWAAWYEQHRAFLEARGVLTYALPDEDEAHPEAEAPVTADAAADR